MELEVPTSDVLVEALEDPECCEAAAERLGRFADASAVPASETAGVIVTPVLTSTSSRTARRLC